MPSTLFDPKTKKIAVLSRKFPERIEELEKLFSSPTNVYIDYANVRPWSNKLGWHIELKRLKQFLDSFSQIISVKIYKGTMTGDKHSEEEIKELKRIGYEVKTKPVKVMRQSINAYRINSTSSDLLKKFIRMCLLLKYDLSTIKYLNDKFEEMNRKGIFFIKDLKCNFDVEIGVDMLLDYRQAKVDTFVLWSGDSDFANPLEQLLAGNKKALLFATARKISSELNDLCQKGLFIYDIQKIRNFICWNKEIQKGLLPPVTQKGSQRREP